MPNDKAVLVISFVGMQTKEVKVSKGLMKIELEDDSQQLEEVVVVGFGQQKKASVVGAITQTTSKVLERTGGVTSLGQALSPYVFIPDEEDIKNWDERINKSEGN